MNSFQKVLKNIITATSITLLICFVAFVIELGIGINSWVHKEHKFTFPWEHSSNKSEVMVTTGGSIQGFTNISTLSVTCETYQLVIENKSSSGKVEVSYCSDKENVTIEQQKHTLCISQKKSFDILSLVKGNSAWGNAGTILISFPKDFYLYEANITTGSGNATIDNLSLEKGIFSTGDGNVQVTNLFAQNADITTGDGNIIFDNVILNDTSVDGGKGTLSFTGRFYNNTNFDIGQGELTLIVYGSRDDYGIKIQKGNGDITIDGENYENVPIEEYGTHQISLKNGTGDCALTFVD